jgi:hypothetical protein
MSKTKNEANRTDELLLDHRTPEDILYDVNHL